jgi:hypothetical protein
LVSMLAPPDLCKMPKRHPKPLPLKVIGSLIVLGDLDSGQPKTRKLSRTLLWLLMLAARIKCFTNFQM